MLSARICPGGGSSVEGPPFEFTCEPVASLHSTETYRQVTSNLENQVSYDNVELAAPEDSAFRRATRWCGPMNSGNLVSAPLRNKAKGACRTHEGLPVRYWRKVGMTSSPHGPDGLGHTRATMAMTMGSKAVRRSESGKIALVRIVLCNSGT